MKYICLLLMMICTSAHAQNMTLKRVAADWRLGSYQRNAVVHGVHVGNSPKLDTKHSPASKSPGVSIGLNTCIAHEETVRATVNGDLHTADGRTYALCSATPSAVRPALASGYAYWTKLFAPSVYPPVAVVCQSDAGVGVYNTTSYRVNDSRENIVNMVRATCQFKVNVKTDRDKNSVGPIDLTSAFHFKMRNTDLKCYYDRTYEDTGAWIIEGYLSNENGVVVNYNRSTGSAIIIPGQSIDKTFKIRDSFPKQGVLKPELWIYDKNPFDDAVFPGLNSQCGSKNLTGIAHQSLNENVEGLNNVQILGVYPLGGTPPNWP